MNNTNDTPQCEWCGHPHPREALCTQRPRFGRRGFLALFGAGIVGALLPDLPRPQSTLMETVLGGVDGSSAKAFTVMLDFNTMITVPEAPPGGWKVRRATWHVGVDGRTVPAGDGQIILDVK